MTAPDPEKPTPRLKLTDVSLTIGGLAILSGISLTAYPGERWAVIGPNGAGKTSLFRIIAGELHPSTGSVELFGENAQSMNMHQRARNGLQRTFQVSQPFNHLTVEQNVLLARRGPHPGRMSMVRSERMDSRAGEEVRHTLQKCGLWHHRHLTPDTLSHGERRQLELAVGTVGEPRLLLLDEPAAGLSASERVPMKESLRALSPALTSLLIEHDMSIALEVVDRVLVMERGEQVAIGSPAEVRADTRVRAIYLREAGQ